MCYLKALLRLVTNMNKIASNRWWIGERSTADDEFLPTCADGYDIKASCPCWEFGCPRELIGWLALWGLGLVDAVVDEWWVDWCLMPVDLGDAPLKTIAGTVCTLAAFLAAADLLVRWWWRVCCCISRGGRIADGGVDFFDRRFRFGLAIPTRAFPAVEGWRDGLLCWYLEYIYENTK